MRARALARIAPFSLRRRIKALKRLYTAHSARQDYNPSSLHYRRAITLLNNSILRDAGSGGPTPPTRLQEAINSHRRLEWQRAAHGRRPIP